MFENADDVQRTDDGPTKDAWLYCKLTSEPMSSGEPKKKKNNKKKKNRKIKQYYPKSAKNHNILNR